MSSFHLDLAESISRLDGHLQIMSDNRRCRFWRRPAGCEGITLAIRNGSEWRRCHARHTHISARCLGKITARDGCRGIPIGMFPAAGIDSARTGSTNIGNAMLTPCKRWFAAAYHRMTAWHCQGDLPSRRDPASRERIGIRETGRWPSNGQAHFSGEQPLWSNLLAMRGGPTGIRTHASRFLRKSVGGLFSPRNRRMPPDYGISDRPLVFAL
jgi:hypothetical protein